jgi:hypothetical protein
VVANAASRLGTTVLVTTTDYMDCLVKGASKIHNNLKRDVGFTQSRNPASNILRLRGIKIQKGRYSDSRHLGTYKLSNMDSAMPDSLTVPTFSQLLHSWIRILGSMGINTQAVMSLITSTLMMETEVSKTLDSNPILRQLIT